MYTCSFEDRSQLCEQPHGRNNLASFCHNITMHILHTFKQTPITRTNINHLLATLPRNQTDHRVSNMERRRYKWNANEQHIHCHHHEHQRDESQNADDDIDQEDRASV
jgi:hypothetical protein